MTYQPNGLLASETRGSVTTSYGYDDVQRLESIADNLAGTSDDVTTTLAYNPANQVTQRTRSNDNYAYTGYVNVSRSYTRNGLNQYSAVGGTAFCYDANGNLISDGRAVYQYDRENRLRWARDAVSTACPPVLTGAIVAGMVYDPLGRLCQSQRIGGATTRYLYDGDELVAEYTPPARS